MANIVLELRDQREDAHDELACPRARVDCRIIDNLELNALRA
jgi:hypothetical protein